MGPRPARVDVADAHHPRPARHRLSVPFFKDLLIPLGMFFPVFAAFVMVGSSNAVNLTDGLDGLAIVRRSSRPRCSR